MKEHFMNGLIGGVMAGIIKDIPNAIFHNLLKVTGLSFWDYAGAIALFRHPEGWGEQLYALLFEVFFSIVMGISFTYLKDRIHTKHYLLRGAVFGGLIWFTVNTAILAFQIQTLIQTDLYTSVVNSVCSIFYGVILAYIILYLEKRSSPNTN